MAPLQYRCFGLFVPSAPSARRGFFAPLIVQIAKVIGDVWLASLVQWVTGRATTADVSKSLDVAVRMLLR